MPAEALRGIRYVVSISEVSYSGVRAMPWLEKFVGRKARARAVDHAQRERRASTLAIQVYPEGGQRRAVVWCYQNPRPVCPCNNPRCESVWAAGRIRFPLESLASVAPWEAIARAPLPCLPLQGCRGFGSEGCR